MAGALPYCYSSTLICNFQMLLSPPTVNYSVLINVAISAISILDQHLSLDFICRLLKAHYNSVIASNPLGVTIRLLHAAHAYRNALTHKKSIEYKERQT